MLPFFENREDSFTIWRSEGIRFPLHQHSHLELFFMLAGECEVTVRKQNRRISPGGLAVIFPNQVHSYQSDVENNRAVLAICDLTLTGSYSATLTKQHPSNPFLPAEALHPSIPYAMNSLLEEFQSEGNSAVYGPLIQLILARTLPLLPLHPNRSADSLELTYQIVHYIAEHFQEPLSLEKLARRLGVSKYHLSHVFSEKMGIGFPEYLASIRLGHACDRLATTDRPVTEIGAEAGFESERTFFRAFHAKYHTSPLQYRNAVQKEGFRG